MRCVISSIQGDTILVTIPKAAGSGPITITANGIITTGPVFNFQYTSYVITVAGSIPINSMDGIGINAGFEYPTGVALDSMGNVFTSEDSGDPRVRKINSAGVVTTFAGSGQLGFQDGPGKIAEFQSLWGIAVDTFQNVYVSDYWNNRIRKITPTGMVSTLAGNGSIGHADGLAASATFNLPVGLTADSKGNVFVADNGNKTIRKISNDGMVSTLTNKGFAVISNAQDSFTTFSFMWPITNDLNGNILVSDGTQIYKISASGVLSILAGNGLEGLQNGRSSQAEFKTIVGITVSPTGIIYVSEELNHDIRQITPDGNVSTLAGSGQYGILDGPAATAQFTSPFGLAVDKNGDIYLADYNAGRIRKIIVQ